MYGLNYYMVKYERQDLVGEIPMSNLLIDVAIELGKTEIFEYLLSKGLTCTTSCSILPFVSGNIGILVSILDHCSKINIAELAKLNKQMTKVQHWLSENKADAICWVSVYPWFSAGSDSTYI